MRPFEYRRAADSAEALRLAHDKEENAALLAGGTDLIPLLKDGVLAPRRLIDIKRLADVGHGIEVTEQGITIGALTTLAEVAGHQALHDCAPLLGEAARVAATAQLRTMATVGGNLLQRPRCWYFRNPAFRCWLAGGDLCHARQGRNDRHAIFGGDAGDPCAAVHPSDLAPCLVALDAEVLLRDAGGEERVLAVEDLLQPPTAARRSETVIDGALLVAVRFNKPGGNVRSHFQKAMDRGAWSFALASVAVRLDFDGDRIEDARVVLGGVANVPRRAVGAEARLRGAAPSEAVFERAADLALADARPLAHNSYKVPLTRALVVAALGALG